MTSFMTNIDAVRDYHGWNCWQSSLLHWRVQYLYGRSLNDYNNIFSHHTTTNKTFLSGLGSKNTQRAEDMHGPRYLVPPISTYPSHCRFPQLPSIHIHLYSKHALLFNEPLYGPRHCPSHSNDGHPHQVWSGPAMRVSVHSDTKGDANNNINSYEFIISYLVGNRQDRVVELEFGCDYRNSLERNRTKASVRYYRSRN